MTNKVITGILILLVILSGGLCFYSYTLYTQIGFLNWQLTALQEEQAARIGAMSDEIINLREENIKGFDILRSEIQGERQKTLTRIETLESDTGKNIARIYALEDEIGEKIALIDTIKAEVGEFTTEFSQSVINAREVYQRVMNTTVRISDGERVHGSGFIIDNKAHVVTAQHVVANLPNIYVVLPDGRISLATITGVCQHSDIAVLTLRDELIIKPLPLAESAGIRIGEPVATIGNPFALTETLTTGIVSQKDRFVEIKYDVKTRWVANLIQFDAAVNSGNSGCPLVNSEGEAIGMVIARTEPDKGDGINYAVSSNKIKRVSASLIAQGHFDYPWLGINIANLTPQLVQTRGLQTSNGVLVKSVLTGGPASAASISAGDIILAIDGIAISEVDDLTSYLGENKSPGDVATIKLLRDTTEAELSLKVGRHSP